MVVIMVPVIAVRTHTTVAHGTTADIGTVGNRKAQFYSDDKAADILCGLFLCARFHAKLRRLSLQDARTALRAYVVVQFARSGPSPSKFVFLFDDSLGKQTGDL
jgi:hypothetical protein